MPMEPEACSLRLLGRPVWRVGVPETRCRRPGEMPLHHERLVPGRPTGRTAGASALPSAISRLTWRSSPARTAPPSCAARIAITISWQSRNRAATSTRNSWRASPHHHRDNTRILHRGTDIASYNEPKALGTTRLNRSKDTPGPAASCMLWASSISCRTGLSRKLAACRNLPATALKTLLLWTFKR
jgi:hypothetical protein